jgi:hypothetical protein
MGRFSFVIVGQHALRRQGLTIHHTLQERAPPASLIPKCRHGRRRPTIHEFAHRKHGRQKALA